VLKDREKGKQAEGKACIKAQDKRKGAWDCGQQPLPDRGGEGRQGWSASQCQTLRTCSGFPTNGCDVKEACVLLEPKDGNLFPARLAVWLRQEKVNGRELKSY